MSNKTKAFYIGSTSIRLNNEYCKTYEEAVEEASERTNEDGVVRNIVKIVAVIKPNRNVIVEEIN